MIKLKNISNIVFGVKGNRTFAPNTTLEFDLKEAETLLTNWKGKIVNENASLEVLQSKDDTIEALKKRLAELEGGEVEAKTSKSKKAKTSKEEKVEEVETEAEEEVEKTNE